VNDDVPDPEPGQGEAPFQPVPTRKALKSVASNLLRPAPRPAPASSLSAKETKQIVNGIDRRERIIAVGLTVLNLYLIIFWRNHLHVSAKASDRAAANTFLEVGLVVVALTIVGIVAKRRALLGFACFLSGLVFLQYKLGVEFAANAGFGGWLILRAQKVQKLQRGGQGRVQPKRAAPRSKAQPTQTVRTPTPSKRYTPPKRTRSGHR
jgi:hypothetical protein